jgi:hypothetical protein
MPFVTTPERIGREQGLREAVQLQLEERFGENAKPLLPHLHSVHDVEVLRDVLRKLAAGASFDAICSLFEQA